MVESEVNLFGQSLDHPCRGTCSGWRQGFEKGRESLRAEYGIASDHLDDMRRIQDAERALEAERRRLRQLIERLRYVSQQVEMSEVARDAFQAIISDYFEASRSE